MLQEHNAEQTREQKAKVAKQHQAPEMPARPPNVIKPPSRDRERGYGMER